MLDDLMKVYLNLKEVEDRKAKYGLDQNWERDFKEAMQINDRNIALSSLFNQFHSEMAQSITKVVNDVHLICAAATPSFRAFLYRQMWGFLGIAADKMKESLDEALEAEVAKPKEESKS